MMEGVITHGTGRGISVGAPVAGKTGTTNDAKDAWFVGYTTNIVAGCYIGYDQPASMPGASGGGLCGPVFTAFMKVATAKYGGASFKAPPGGYFAKIDRFTGVRLPDDASGENVVAEYFRSGVETLVAIVDGGFAIGQNLQLFAPGEAEEGEGGVEVVTSDGSTRIIPEKADFGTVSAGGLY
jgi:penicillin-binding protein 1A